MAKCRALTWTRTFFEGGRLRVGQASGGISETQAGATKKKIGKLLVFSSSLPTVGLGVLRSRDNHRAYGTEQERALLTPTEQLYPTLAQQVPSTHTEIITRTHTSLYIHTYRHRRQRLVLCCRWHPVFALSVPTRAFQWCRGHAPPPWLPCMSVHMPTQLQQKKM